MTKTKTIFLISMISIGLALGAVTGRPHASAQGATAINLMNPAVPPARKLVPHGRVRVAFVVTDDAVMIDFAGPWEVFQDVDVMTPAKVTEVKGDSARGMKEMKPEGGGMPDMRAFELYVVSDTKRPVRVSGGMQVVPDYTFDDAPQPDVVVVPAQTGSSPKMMNWIRRMAMRSDVVMSVCAGAFTLGEAGLLEGKKATTHHNLYASLQHQVPTAQIVRDMRYVQSDSVIYTSGGLSSGIDLALHIVDLYYGRDVARITARRLEYESQGWLRDGKASVTYARPSQHTPADGLNDGALGNWQGTLKTKKGESPFIVHLWRDAAGQMNGNVDATDDDVSPFHSMDDRVSGFPLSSIRVDHGALRFELANVGGVYAGTLNPRAPTIDGVWTQQSERSPLTLTRQK